MSIPSLFKPERESRYGRYIKIGLGVLAGVVVVGALYFALFRFHSEQATVAQFMNDVVAGDFQPAYKMWAKDSSYSYSEFLQDWGPKGYYGPVHSYEIIGTSEPSGASGVIVIVAVSRFSTFPSESELEKGMPTKQVRLWVQFSDHSISYAPFTT